MENFETVEQVAIPQFTVNTLKPDTTAKAETSTDNGSPQSIEQTLQQLIVQREQWQATVYRASNDQLYGILQACYGLYKSMEGTSSEAKELRKQLDAHIKANRYSFQPSTHTLTKIVKCVFGADRRRVSAYSIALRAALQASIGTVDIPSFIRDNGGVEEMRLAKAPNAMTSKQKAVAGADAVLGKNIGVFASAELNTMLDAGKIGTPVVLIGTWQADASIVVRTVVQNDTAINAALASYYSSNKTQVTAQIAQQVAANDASLTHSAINAAAQSAIVATA